MSDPTGAVPAEGAPAPESTAPEQSAPEPQPWAPVLDRMDELAGNIGSFDQRFQALESRLPEPQAPAEPDPWAALMGGEPEEPQYFDQYGNPVDLQPQQPAFDLNALQQAIQHDRQQALAPLQQQLQEMQLNAAREQLLKEIPQLQDPEVANQTAQAMQAYLNEAGAPPEVAAWLSNSPKAIGQFFKAAEAEKRAQAQVPAPADVPALEAAGGAVPGGDGSQPSYVQSAHQGAWGGLPRGFR